jgi:hypothetical protein
MGVSVCHGHGLPGQGQPAYPSALFEPLFCFVLQILNALTKKNESMGFQISTSTKPDP